jgi:hypothetical protein
LVAVVELGDRMQVLNRRSLDIPNPPPLPAAPLK